VVANTRLVLAIETLAAARALDLLRPLRSSPPIENAREKLREISAAWDGDRPLSADIEAVAAWIGGGGLE